MTKAYKATGINLKAQPLGESDKIVTILTKEFGLIKAIAPGARKPKSHLGGRTGLFIVNELLIHPGKSLNTITQAQTIKSYFSLSQNLGKLAASQYLAEIVLHQALSEQSQIEIYDLLNKSLERLEKIPNHATTSIIAYLTQGVFELLALAGLTPEVERCCLTQRVLTPDLQNPFWQVGFSISAGGIICLKAWEVLRKQREMERKENKEIESNFSTSIANSSGYETVFHQQEIPIINRRLNGKQLIMLQYLSQTEIIQIDAASDSGWLSVEQILRQYVQYHLGHSIRSATLIDSYFATQL